MNRKELFICTSVATAVSFFSSIAEIVKQSTRVSLHLSDSDEQVVKSEYKLPVYKLWQYVTKNKPSVQNDGVVSLNNKEYFYIQRNFVSHQHSLESFWQSENYTKPPASINPKKQLSLENNLSFCKHLGCRRIVWRNLSNFVSYIFADRIFSYVKSILRKFSVCGYKKYFNLKNPALRSYRSAMRQWSIRSHKIDIYVNNLFYC
ncbi:hypothetical protein [Bartonella sp. CB169]|uniref:hypothetical protein n=1 Tax=Bartonella sp. CB169 TaxID=3112257 RepID=UPI00300DC00D